MSFAQILPCLLRDFGNKMLYKNANDKDEPGTPYTDTAF